MSPSSSKNLKVEFDEKRFKYLLTVHPEYLETWEVPPQHVVDSSIKAHLDAKFPSRIPHCTFFPDRLKAVWNMLKLRPKQDYVQVVVAEFYPDLPGVQLEFDLEHEGHLFLTLPNNPQLIQTWHPAWLEALINLKIVAAGFVGLVNPAQIRCVYSRVIYFYEHVERESISFASRSNPAKSGKNCHILVNADRMEIEVAIGNVQAMANEDVRKQLYGEIKQALYKIAHTAGRSPFYKDMRKVIEKSLDLALHQPQAIGLELPLLLPGAFFVRNVDDRADLADLRTIAAFQRTRHPEQESFPLDYMSKVELDHRLNMLKGRGLLIADPKHPGQLVAFANLFPVHSLQTLPKPIAQGYLDFARHGRLNFLSSHRELQAMVFTLPAKNVETYIKEVETFWMKFIAEFSKPQTGDMNVTVLSHFFPMTLPASQRKPQAKNRQSQQSHDNAAWLPMVVREIVTIPSIPSEPAAIASSLVPNVSEQAVKKSLEGLLAAGLLSYDSLTKKYYQKDKNILTGDEKVADKIRRLHEEMSELSEAVLADPPTTMRSTAMTICLESGTFELAKGSIRSWLVGVLERTGREQGQDQLFQLSVQMFQGPS